MVLRKENEPTASGSGSAQTISIKILDAGVNEKQAWAHVAGWIGPEEHPRQWVEDWISIVFQFELEALRVAAAQGGRPHAITVAPDWTLCLRLLEPQDEEDVLAKLTELKRVAPDAVAEKVTSRVVRRLLGIEWRDPEEITLELAEAHRAE